MRRSIYLLTILLLVLITSCKDNQEVVAPDSTAKIKINLLNLNGGEKLTAGSAQIIKWYSNTSINSIDIDYSTNGGNSWDTLAYNVPNTGSYLWTPVPKKVSNYCLVKISTRDQGKAVAYSADYFSIVTDSTQKVLTLLAPNSGSVVYVDNNYKITWTSKGIASVKISLSTDNGSTWGLIAANTPGDSGYYMWRPTAAMQSSQCKMKIADVSADTIVSINNGVFMITVPQAISIVQPAGGETVYAGQSYDIKWTSSQVANVKIEYTTNNGVSWSNIAESTPSSGFYSWNPVPATISNNCKIRISDAADGFPAETSLNVFSIQKAPTLKLISPNGGEQLQAGSSTTITWSSESSSITPASVKVGGTTALLDVDDAHAVNKVEGVKSVKSGPISNVKVEYTTNDGATWSIIKASTLNNGSCVWDTIPAVNSSLCRVKISDVNGGIPSTVSSKTFTIFTQAAKLIKVTSPNGAEAWQAGTAQNITWTSTGVTAVKIEYTTNNGVEWKSISANTASNGLYVWNSVPATPSTNCKIRVSDISDLNINDVSDAVFSILPEPSIVVTSPNGGEVFQSGNIKQITWTSVSIANVKIEYTINGGADWKLIVADTVSSGVYNWTVPNENTAQAKVRISKAGTGFPFGVSATNFTINNQIVKQLAIIAPNGGETWLAGTSQQIKWTGSGVTKVNVQYTADNGITWNTIASNISSTGAFSWDPVPNVTSTQCLVKVTDAADSKTTAVSNGPFAISPVKTIKILKPVAGDVWTAGIPDTIKWSSTGLSNVRIEYTVNNGLDSASWFNLTPSTASSGTYVTAFSVPSSQCKIRISGVPDNSPSVVSNGTFTVLEQPSITVTAPKDGDQLYAGVATNITWKSNNITDVKIEFTTNNGATWSVIENSVPSSGLYRWVIPNDPLLNSSQCKIRISNAVNNGIPSGTSTGAFAINQVLPGIIVKSPNGGEVWYSGSAQVIKWNSTSVTNVKIEFSTNNGVDWAIVAASVPSNGFYNWNPVPSTSSTNCKVRISDVDNKYSDVSDNYFTVSPEPSIAVLSPNGGEQLQTGSTKNITWTSTNIAKVKLEYTTNNGANWYVIVDSVESNGTYAWVVPNVNSNLCRIKVSEARNGIPYAVSTNNFTINNQIVKQLTLIKPVGGEVWDAGTSQVISWTASGVTNVKLEYTTNNGITWDTIKTNVISSGAYEWSPIPNVSSTQCKVRISDAFTGTPVDQSKNVFTINPIPSIKVTYPNGGEVWYGGSVHNITWESIGVQNVKIESSSNNGLTWIPIIASTPSNGVYSWSTTIPSSQYKIKVSNVISPNVPSDESDGTFTVTPEPSISIIAPNGGEVYVAGTSQNISWTSSNITNVKLEYTINNGATWILIKDDTLNTGLFKWLIPNVNSSLCKVRISNAQNNNIPSIISAATFNINQVAPVITVTSPIGGEVWDGGSAQVIKWNSSGIENVKIDYTTNNGVTWLPVTANTSSSGFYSWNPIPKTPSTNCKVRVSDLSNNFSGQSPLTFTIAPEPSIKIVEPNGGEMYQAGSVKQIKWTSVNVARIKIEYTVNGGADWKVIVADTTSSGVFDWLVPNENTAQAKVRVSKAGSGIPFGISENNFSISNKIVKQLSIISPNGGENWSAGTSQQIKWSGSGVTNVKIEYTTDNGLNWQVISANTASTGAYSWDPIPNVTSTQCLVRISDVNAGGPSTVSNATFSISPVKTITILRPAAGEMWTAGVPDTIKWTSTGLSNVKIEFTINNGLRETDWTTLTASTVSNGVYVTAFSVASTQYKVRITGVPEGSPTALSNGTFTVLEQPSITVLSPASGEQLLAGSTKDILWNSVNIANVKIELTTNNGASWSPIVASTPSNGRFAWTVPTDPPVNSSLCKIRISNVANSGIPSAMTAGNFTINQVAPGITITAPNGGESWDAGSAQVIKWNSLGVTNVKIEYTTNNGVAWTQIAASVSSNGFYSWNPIPNTPSTNCKIKISDVDNKYTDQSDAFFTIAPEPAISVTAPIGGETLKTGSEFQIKWTSVNVARIKIDYTVNGGADWKTIVSDTTSSGVYNWTVPNENTAQARVRVSKVGLGVPFGISPANFTISNQVVKQLAILAPNGGESWSAGTAQQIKWSGSGVTSVKIEYSSDNGINWNTINSSTPSTGSYSWDPVPNINSTQCLVRISDAVNGTPSAVSSAPFAINPVKSLRIIKPVAGDTWTAGVPDTIKWVSSGLEKVKIEYTINNGVEPKDWNVLTAGTESNGVYVTGFSVPSALYKIRISGLPDGYPSAESNGTFTVLEQPSITVTAPKNGDMFVAGTTQNITWNSANITHVKIELTTNNGATWAQISPMTPSNGLYQWVIPTGVNSSLCRVRISNAFNNGNPSAMSTGSFTINQVAPEIKVTQPNGGEVWYVSSAQIIKWNSTGITNVKIDFTTNNGVEWLPIVASTSSTGYYNWNPVPNVTSTNCRIRVSDLSSNYSDQSDNVFTIAPEPSIAVTSPVGGENLLAGSVKNITWTSTNIYKVKLEYTTNNGANWTVITDSIESTGNYSWTVPNVNSNLCRIKVSEARNGIPWAISPNNFTINNQIVKEITLLAPVGGESWPAGTQQMILWKATGITRVNIDYTTNNGIAWIPIIRNQVSTGAYEWGPIPNINSTQCKVRVSDTSGAAQDESKNVFSISPVPKVKILSPNGGETWLGGEVHNITWISNGVTNVKIESTTDNGFSWQTLIGSTPSADTSYYAWSSSVPSQYYKIRVSNVANFGIPSDESDGTFTILPEPSIRVVSPNGGENLIAGQSHEIRWVSANIDSVKIEFTLDNGFTWIPIIEKVKSNGLYNWYIDSSKIAFRSDLCKVRITEIGGLQHSDMSDGLFTIHPKEKMLRIVYPNGGEYLIKTTSFPVIKWVSAGISNVNLEYTSNNGVSWEVIELNSPSDGAYVWNFPDALVSSLARIRISDANPAPGETPLSDVSDSYFYIGILPGRVTIIPEPKPVIINQATDIKWTASKEIGNFKLEYSLNDGSTWNLISENIPNKMFNNYSWKVPAELADKNIIYRVVEMSTGKAAESSRFNVQK